MHQKTLAQRQDIEACFERLRENQATIRTLSDTHRTLCDARNAATAIVPASPMGITTPTKVPVLPHSAEWLAMEMASSALDRTGPDAWGPVTPLHSASETSEADESDEDLDVMETSLSMRQLVHAVTSHAMQTVGLPRESPIGVQSRPILNATAPRPPVVIITKNRCQRGSFSS